MKTAALVVTAYLAIAFTEAIAPIPKEHHARFLEERQTLINELNAWKSSLVGRVAKKNGFFHEDPHESTAALNDQLARLFLTKLSIKKAQRENPKARFSLNSPFSLMTELEFAQFVARSSGNSASHARPALNATRTAPHRQLETVATSVDWSTGKCMAPVKNQGDCSSCWAFSAIAALESAICIKTGNLTVLSEQELVSCDHIDVGCEGGTTSAANWYLRSNGAVSTAASYPYVSGETAKDETCSLEGRAKVSFSFSSNEFLLGSETEYIAAINRQPISVSIAAGNKAFKQYAGGVLSNCGNNSMLDHAVLAVGYDGESFKIRNSWGPAWGEGGYVHLERQGEGTAACNLINEDASYPVLE